MATDEDGASTSTFASLPKDVLHAIFAYLMSIATPAEVADVLDSLLVIDRATQAALRPERPGLRVALMLARCVTAKRALLNAARNCVVDAVVWLLHVQQVPGDVYGGKCLSAAALGGAVEFDATAHDAASIASIASSAALALKRRHARALATCRALLQAPTAPPAADAHESQALKNAACTGNAALCRLLRRQRVRPARADATRSESLELALRCGPDAADTCRALMDPRWPHPARPSRQAVLAALDWGADACDACQAVLDACLAATPPLDLDGVGVGERISRARVSHAKVAAWAGDAAESGDHHPLQRRLYVAGPLVASQVLLLGARIADPHVCEPALARIASLWAAGCGDALLAAIDAQAKGASERTLVCKMLLRTPEAPWTLPLRAALVAASACGLTEVCAAILGVGDFVRADVQGGAALIAAARGGHPAACRLLLAERERAEPALFVLRSADIKHAALMAAVRASRCLVCQVLLAELAHNGADARRNDGEALFDAIAGGKPRVVSLLLGFDAPHSRRPVNRVLADVRGGAALRWAVAVGSADVCRLLLAQTLGVGGSFVLSCVDAQHAALMLAVAAADPQRVSGTDRLDVCTALLVCGEVGGLDGDGARVFNCNVAHADHNHGEALLLAVVRGDVELARLLLGLGASRALCTPFPAMADERGLAAAVTAGDVQMCELLLGEHVDADVGQDAAGGARRAAHPVAGDVLDGKLIAVAVRRRDSRTRDLLLQHARNKGVALQVAVEAAMNVGDDDAVLALVTSAGSV
jgi:hypothetical protein